MELNFEIIIYEDDEFRVEANFSSQIFPELLFVKTRVRMNENDDQFMIHLKHCDLSSFYKNDTDHWVLTDSHDIIIDGRNYSSEAGIGKLMIQFSANEQNYHKFNFGYFVVRGGKMYNSKFFLEIF